MKKILIISLVATLVLSGCKDFLIEEPLLDNSTEIQLSDYGGLNAAVAGAYAPLASGTWYGASYVLNSEMRAGNAQRPSNADFTSGRMMTPYNLTYSPDQTEGLWGLGYYVISAANNVLESLDEKGETLLSQVVSEQDLKNLRAECLFLRAFSHFDMLRLYSKAKTPELGIPVILKTDKTLSEKPARNTVADTYAQIEQDLTDAESLIDPEYVRDGFIDPTGSVSIHAIRALLARVYLYDASWGGDQEKYQKAADYATKVIGSGKYKFWTAKEYTSVWNKESFEGGEVIFSVYGNKSNAYDAYWEGPSHMTNPKGYGDCAASPDLTDIFDDPNDVRGTKGVRGDDDGKVMFCTDSKEASGGQLWTMKYYGKGIGDAANSPDFNNTVVLRLSEMYLIRAEALNGGARISGTTALQDLNAIRQNRNAAPLAAAGREVVAKERRLELNFEGHLWFDLARTTCSITFSDGKERGRDLVSVDSPLWALPIPKRETDVNENLIQNELE